MIKEFTVGVKHHVNLGDYESMEIQASVTLDIEDGDFSQARMEVQEALTALLDDSFHSQRFPEWFAEIPRKQMKKNAVQSVASRSTARDPISG